MVEKDGLLLSGGQRGFFEKYFFPLGSQGHSNSENKELCHIKADITFLDAIASPSTYPCQWSVSGSVIDSFRLEIA